ncbi:DUF2970 domain-containing protein [Simiduia curdlanivorans]|uniref:DUF2970 domain-containing protein n=1 Tax=Simiduia curdlanivorans TaxID=1492769 RepID=A0ABV8V969_9GAMM|nr:DUF2970 domain-containing protein [Simiduia curdlanivorans]MDN3639701.1 DUF2970 domain-containing protein [Simiduia curdlanivorans]
MTEEKTDKPNFFNIVLSTMAAAFGVQSKRNQERDFKGGNIYHYIVAGILFTVIFIVTVTLVVQSVLQANGL